MGRRRLASLGAVALVAVACALPAGASDSAGRPAGSPDLAAMSLAVQDFPTGARVTRQRYYRDPDFVASYEREFSLGGTQVGRSSVVYVFTGLDVEGTLAAARATFVEAKALLASKRFRDAFARELARQADLPARSVTIGRPRAPRIGDGAMTLSMKLKAQGRSLQITVTLLRVDRVLGSIVLIGLPGKKLFPADTDRVTRAGADRMLRGLVPAVSRQPVVTGLGTTTPGQTLSAQEGLWTGDELTFSYQWERCLEADSSCAPIAGATGETYTLTTGDLGSRLRVTVTGRNRLGSETATSPSTVFVTGPAGSPVATATPAIGGVVAPGATLTIAAGTWNGSPTSFAFQWRRCSATTGACVDIAGATGETYTLTAADSGSLLRVLVVATNASGSGGALSAPTAPAP
jgi:hypothetical protein